MTTATVTVTVVQSPRAGVQNTLRMTNLPQHAVRWREQYASHTRTCS
jgi:hypothetical protein